MADFQQNPNYKYAGEVKLNRFTRREIVQVSR